MPDVTISGVGSTVTVPVPDGSSLEVALNDANVDADGAGLQVSVNGNRVSEPAQHQVQNGDQVTVSPRNAKLGS